MNKNQHGMPQPKQEALEQAHTIRESLQDFEGNDLGYGLIFNKGALTPSFDKESSPYLLGEDGKPLTFFHYRNLSTVTQPGNADFHDLMHFGTPRAAHSRAFSKRLLQSGQQFSEELLNTKIFNQCAHAPIKIDGDFGDEIILAARIQAKKPYFIPDIGQTQYFKNRAVLYACGLFEEHEVDNDLFDKDGFPQNDVDQKVLIRLRERGYDSIAYLNDIEDPESLSLIILDKQQAESVAIERVDFPGFRYRFGPPGSTDVVDCDNARNIQVLKVPKGQERIPG